MQDCIPARQQPKRLILRNWRQPHWALEHANTDVAGGIPLTCDVGRRAEIIKRTPATRVARTGAVWRRCSDSGLQSIQRSQQFHFIQQIQGLQPGAQQFAFFATRPWVLARSFSLAIKAKSCSGMAKRSLILRTLALRTLATGLVTAFFLTATGATVGFFLTLLATFLVATGFLDDSAVGDFDTNNLEA
jgi:hypothetical protein